jgi:TolB-like protein
MGSSANGGPRRGRAPGCARDRRRVVVLRPGRGPARGRDDTISEPLSANKASLAVLPFTNLSGDIKQERLADGLTEDLITELARYRWLFVIARQSSFAYKGEARDVREIARELGVRYVLEGSLQTDPERVRVTGQLIDGTTGAHVWSERYDRPLSEFFDLRDEITQQIAGTLTGHLGPLVTVTADVARSKPPGSLEAYDYIGTRIVSRLSPPYPQRVTTGLSRPAGRRSALRPTAVEASVRMSGLRRYLGQLRPVRDSTPSRR